MKQLNQKVPAVFCAGLVLLCAVLISSHLTSGLYARYTTSASAGDSAVVAAFEIGEDMASSSAMIEVTAKPPATEGETQTVQRVQISNSSDTTVKYTITATNLTGNLPIQIDALEGSLDPNEEIISDIAIQWTDALKDPKNAGRVDLVRLTISVEQSPDS